jgi:hypothetical protein
VDGGVLQHRRVRGCEQGRDEFVVAHALRQGGRVCELSETRRVWEMGELVVRRTL